MIVTKENERLYLSNWEYNASRITTAIATIVENNNGVVRPNKKAIVSNRTLDTTKRDLIERIEKLEQKQSEEYGEIRAKYISEKRAELEKMKSIKNDPITVTHTTYISFVLNDTYYSYSMDTNPFFDFHYSKVPVANNKYSRDYYSDKDNKEWFYDCFFSFDVSDSDIKEAANLIFNMLVKAPYSEKYVNKKRVRVPNSSNNGYHYETIVEKERFEKIEWLKMEEK